MKARQVRGKWPFKAPSQTLGGLVGKSSCSTFNAQAGIRVLSRVSALVERRDCILELIDY
jgi:hypothetical protein